MRTGTRAPVRLGPRCEAITRAGARCKRAAVLIGKRNLCRQHATAAK